MEARIKANASLARFAYSTQFRMARTEKLEERVCGDCVHYAYCFYFWGLRQVLWVLERGSDVSEDKLTDSCFKTPSLYDLDWEIRCCNEIVRIFFLTS